MPSFLKRDPVKELVSALRSVSTINQIVAKDNKTRDDINALKINIKQLQTVVALTIWTNQDLTSLYQAIATGNAWLALGIEPSEPQPPAPEPVSEYPWGNGEPTLPQLEEYLQVLRNAKDKEINAQRLAANNSFFTFQGKKIACDPLSRSDIDGANGYILLNGELPSPWPGGWKTIDNSYVPIDSVATWKQFYGAMYTQGIMNFAKAQQLKQQTQTATTIEAIRAITW